MGVAYSENGPPIWAPIINGGTAASFLAGIHAAMKAAGIDWETITDGYRYQLKSDQNFTCKVAFWDAGTDPLLGGKGRLLCRFYSDDLSNPGVQYPLIYDTGRNYEMIVSRQQLFLALTGYSSNLFNGQTANAVCGGIPYVPDLPLICLDEPLTISSSPSEVWWASGAGYGLFSVGDGYGFRSGWRNAAWWDAMWDGTKVGGFLDNGVDSGAGLRMAVITAPGRDWDTVQQTQWQDQTPLYYEPMLIWGLAKNTRARIRVQLWDAVAASKHVAVGNEIVSQEYSNQGELLGDFTWRNYMGFQGTMPDYNNRGSWFGSLYLLRDMKPQADQLLSNYVY